MIDFARQYLSDPHVAGVFLTGSRATGSHDEQSDYDIVVVTTGAVNKTLRERIARQSEPDALDLSPGHFGDSDAWRAGGIDYDVMFWDLGWLADTLTGVIRNHQVSEGYTTAHWHTVANWALIGINPAYQARIDQLTELAGTPYSDKLSEAIIAHNFSLIRPVIFSYEQQLSKAVSRGDIISVNHRIAALIASWADIVFAAHKTTHPGEKKLIDHLASLGDLPENYEADLTQLAEGDAGIAKDLIDRLESWLDRRGQLPQA